MVQSAFFEAGSVLASFICLLSQEKMAVSRQAEPNAFCSDHLIFRFWAEATSGYAIATAKRLALDTCERGATMKFVRRDKIRSYFWVPRVGTAGKHLACKCQGWRFPKEEFPKNVEYRNARRARGYAAKVFGKSSMQNTKNTIYIKHSCVLSSFPK